MALLAAVALVACAGGEGAPPASGGTGGGSTGATASVEAGSSSRVEGLRPGEWVATEEDWRIVREKVRWARENGLDTLPVGDAVARLGRTFVGTPYVPHTLEVGGPERLVVNLRALDCVTFVETVLALVHVTRTGPTLGSAATGGAPAASETLRAAYGAVLTRIRYRDGVLDGYPSRLHYFSEWIADAEEKGLIRSMTRALGGVEDPEPVTFMSEHPDAYRQLADSGVLAAIRRIEDRLSRTPLVYLPEGRIEQAVDRIRSGDIIAATSSVPGLDVAHTGIAVRREGRVHLLHAPLVGDSVQISEQPLARRISRIGSQDGLQVARPLDPKQNTSSR